MSSNSQFPRRCILLYVCHDLDRQYNAPSNTDSIGFPCPSRRAAYQTWTLVTALPTTLFYFSVWKLALAGPEFSTLATLAPCVLGFPAVLNFARSKYGRAFLSAVGAVAGIGCWRAESVWTRLGGVVVGVMAGLMRWGAEWEEGQAYHGVGEHLGVNIGDSDKPLLQCLYWVLWSLRFQNISIMETTLVCSFSRSC